MKTAIFLKKFTAGKITAFIWQEVNGSRTVSLRKNLYDSTFELKIADIPKAQFLIQKAHDYLVALETAPEEVRK